MRTNTRLKLDMAGRALGFCRLHPDANPSTELVTARLGELVGQTIAIGQQRREAEVTAAAAVGEKEALREVIAGKLTSLAGISKVVAQFKPAVGVHRRLPRGKVSEPAFLSIARVAVAGALANRELFLQHGMPDTLLQEMTTDLDTYEAAILRQRNAEVTEVGANAELEAVTAEIMGVVKHLDSLHRLRFKDNTELKAGWKSARNVAWRNADPTAGPVTPPLMLPPAERTSAA